jgi:hypothetical protein
MKLSSMLAGLALAGIMAGSLYAQDGGGGGGGPGGGFGRGRGGFGGPVLKWSDFKFPTAPADSNTPALNQAIYEAAALSKLPEGVDQDQAKTRIDARFIAIAKAAGVTDPTPDTQLSEFQYYKGVVNSMGQGGGGRGGKKKKSADST